MRLQQLAARRRRSSHLPLTCAIARAFVRRPTPSRASLAAWTSSSTNAGFLDHFVPLLESNEDEYWRSWEVNHRGVYWVTKDLVPLLLKGGDKAIVNTTSIGALPITRGGSGYQISKLAVLRFSQYLVAEFGDQVRNASLPTMSSWCSCHRRIRLIGQQGMAQLLCPPRRG